MNHDAHPRLGDIAQLYTQCDYPVKCNPISSPVALIDPLPSLRFAQYDRLGVRRSPEKRVPLIVKCLSPRQAFDSPSDSRYNWIYPLPGEGILLNGGASRWETRAQ